MEPDHLKAEDSEMPADCAEELRANERNNLLTADGTSVCSLQCEGFSSLKYFIDVATLILRFCSLTTPGSRVK